MATISSGRWDWWNEYTVKDEVVDCLIMLSKALGRWPEHKEVTEVWPEYTLRFMQEKFGSYDLLKSEVSDKLRHKSWGYHVKESPKKLAFTAEQLLVIAEITKRSQEESKLRLLSQEENPVTTPKSTEVVSKVRTVPMEVASNKGRPGRKPTFSDEQLLAFARQIVAANDGIMPTTVRAKELLREQNGPSLATMTNRLGPISGWERRLENAS